MTSDEFMRRYEAMPGLRCAELIDGIVYMPSPTSTEHGVFHAELNMVVSVYVAGTPGTKSDDGATWLMGKEQVPEPDLSLWILPQRGGQTRAAGAYMAGAPEFVAEVSLSSKARDLGVKLRMYEKAGVREYLVALVSKQRLVWHESTPNGFKVIEPGPDGTLRSRCFPGLWIDSAAFWRDDRAAVLAVLQQGLASAEHTAFVAR